MDMEDNKTISINDTNCPIFNDEVLLKCEIPCKRNNQDSLTRCYCYSDPEKFDKEPSCPDQYQITFSKKFSPKEVIRNGSSEISESKNLWDICRDQDTNALVGKMKINNTYFETLKKNCLASNFPLDNNTDTHDNKYRECFLNHEGAPPLFDSSNYQTSEVFLCRDVLPPYFDGPLESGYGWIGRSLTLMILAMAIVIVFKLIRIAIAEKCSNYSNQRDTNDPQPTKMNQKQTSV